MSKKEAYYNASLAGRKYCFSPRIKAVCEKLQKHIVIYAKLDGITSVQA